MSFDLLETVKNLFTGEVVGKAADQLGESEGGIQKALGGIVPTVLAGLLNKAGGTPGEAAGALDIAKEAAGADTQHSIFHALTNNAGGLAGQGIDLLGRLFGDKVSSIAGMISSFAGIKSTSAQALLSAAAPAALGVAGQYANQHNLGPSGFTEFLNSQKDKILSAVPGGFNLAGLLGLGNLGELGKRLGGLTGHVADGVRDTAGRVTGAATGAANKASGNRWLWSLILILAAIILLWYLMKGCGGKHSTDSVTTTDSTVTAAHSGDSVAAPGVAAPAASEAVRENIQVTLPDGTVLDAYKGGIEDQLVQFLKDDSKSAGKDVWFDFDNLNFKTNSAEITDESKKQVTNIAAILKAFPKVKIKIGGYTDKSGDDAVNLRISQSRAEAVDNELKRLHAAAGQLLGAEGYGSKFAKASANAPDEERKKDRHISISVREK
ncbi:OmpA family protein [Chitinophaga pendula]|uniref:OmpA family protein n=1 Tax=Chitinophaga TaxID=79328 RepID=UPI000BB092BA|nr:MULTISPECIES: OmpA family protein [Chitinophaga]ASZ13629.1 hypothetical protein CK934_23090 [Chitinophaga sp. MD30]UCJ08746.1 OmpA family protein [Chitinophaga pendula]